MLQALHAHAANDTSLETHRHAYNAAFHHLDMNWHWDAATFGRVQAQGRAGLRAYLESEQAHLLRAYSADFLVEVIEQTKARCLAAMAPPVAAAVAPRAAPAASRIAA